MGAFLAIQLAGLLTQGLRIILHLGMALNKKSSFLAYNPPTGQKSIQVFIVHLCLIASFHISQREWDTYNPITDPLDPNIACNVDGSSLGSGQLSATVPAGSQIKATWNQWPHTVGREYQTIV